jgi:hypothetical protein
MGYYSDFEIDVDGKPLSDWENEGVKEVLSENIDYHVSGDGIYDAKWYDFQEDMTWLSSEYPDKLFCLTRNAEDGIMTRFYYKNGKSHEVTYNWEPYDESKLK